MDIVYFDANATTPIDPRVAAEMARVERETPGNPSSAHRAGRAARAGLEDARERIAARIGARPREIVFTSGGTESINLALRGRALAAGAGRLVTTAVEHPATLRTAGALERLGFAVTRLPVDADGRPELAAFDAALGDDTFLASVMLANNETGTILPVAELAGAARARGVLFHTDAVQALGKIPVDVERLGVDLLSAGAHKIGGPRGIGFLYVRGGTRIEPVLTGGSQEHGLRPGTVPVSLAAGFAAALDLAAEEAETRTAALTALRDRLRTGIEEGVPGVEWNSPAPGGLPNTLNLTVRGVSGEALLIALDQEGICIATGSACASGSALPSHVLTAMGRSVRDVTSSIRISLFPGNTAREAERFLAVLPGIVARLRAVSGAS
jgi:cysteine desulfurase